MPTYKVLLDGKDTGNLVTGTNYADAYFDVASLIPLTYKNVVELKELETPDEVLH
ncbi:hypothetical protein [Dendrosporobacter sp. 1207_IL3150]|uniref:hypothetical protein n=1 Tax=Dendrosporobacter sp. 1207_IL3150 TaxID=3084054 RepID=UPI002FD9302F